MIRKGRPVTPSAASSLTASPWNTVVPINPAGVPARASSTASWRLHDVHEPQSAEPAKTRSHVFASSARISGAAGVDALALRRRRTAFTPWRSRKSIPISSASRSKLCLVLSRKPTVRPASDEGSAGTLSVTSLTSPMGLSTRIRVMRRPPFPSAGRRSGAPTHPGRSRQQPAQRLVQLSQHGPLDPHGNRFHGLPAPHSMNDERARELLGALVGGRQSAQDQQLPLLGHADILPEACRPGG